MISGIIKLYARFGYVSIFNTAFGLSLFPLAVTTFQNSNLLLVMAICHILAVSFSYVTHSKFTFFAKLTFFRAILFFLVHFLAFLCIYFCTIWSVSVSNFDIRVIQPIMAIVIQFAFVPLYRITLR